MAFDAGGSRLVENECSSARITSPVHRLDKLRHFHALEFRFQVCRGLAIRDVWSDSQQQVQHGYDGDSVHGRYLSGGFGDGPLK